MADLFKIYKNEARKVPECITRHKKWDLGFFGRPFGSESVSRTRAEQSDIRFIDVLVSLGYLGCHFGAHWILKWVLKVMMFEEVPYKIRKCAVQERGTKNMTLLLIFDVKIRGPEI